MMFEMLVGTHTDFVPSKHVRFMEKFENAISHTWEGPKVSSIISSPLFVCELSPSSRETLEILFSIFFDEWVQAEPARKSWQILDHIISPIFGQHASRKAEDTWIYHEELMICSWPKSYGLL